MANTKRYVFVNTVIRLFTRACASEEEVLFGRSVIRQIVYMWVTTYIIHNKIIIKTETCNVLLAWEPPFKKI